ncbi:MAG: relaxase/mobilization nuclease domain-containing protein [Flavonifractor plautii]
MTPDQAHAVGVEFARRLLGDRYEAVVSTHLNKAHLHSHIVFNSVSFVDGAMYRDQLKDYYGGDGVGIRGTSDAICREHGLSIIEPSEPLGGPVSRAEWEAARQGKATVRDLIRQDVDEAIRQAYTYQSFLSQLRRMGYRVKTGPRVKHTAILPPVGKGISVWTA